MATYQAVIEFEANDQNRAIEYADSLGFYDYEYDSPDKRYVQEKGE